MRNLAAPRPSLLINNKRFRGIQTRLSWNRPENAAMPRSPVPLSPDQHPAKSPRTFGNGAVGLGIVAAMSAADADYKPVAASPPRSEPILIVAPRPRPKGPQSAEAGKEKEEGRPRRPRSADAGEEDEDDEEELSEGYTCVISHVAGSAVRKRVYFDDGYNGVTQNYGESSGMFFQSPPERKVADLMKRCYFCAKKLHGIDIFMYRGDKAFCSSECRCQQIVKDECSSGAFEYYSGSPLLFSVGVAAA